MQSRQYPAAPGWRPARRKGQRPAPRHSPAAPERSYAATTAHQALFFFLKGAMPARASSSARSFSGWPAWPLTHSQVTLWRACASSSRCHSSTFFTGFLFEVFQPFLLPAEDPAGDAVLHIGRVGDHGDGGRPRQAFQRVDCGQQFHPVVGGLTLAAAAVLFL